MTRRLLLAGLVLAALLALAWALRPPFRQWQQRRLLVSAEAFLARGDLRSASLASRQILRVAPANRRALEMMARIAQAVGSPEAILWQQRLVETSPGELQPALDLARMAIGFGEIYLADKALSEIPQSQRDSAQFHSTAAALAVEAGRLAEAEEHLSRAINREPSSLALQMNLATIRLKSPDPAKIAAARETLTRLGGTPELRPTALRALLADARREGDAPRALQLARDLTREPAATPGDRLLLLEELQHSKSPDFPDELRLVQQASVTPAAAGTLLAWMNARGLAADAVAWAKVLPESTSARMPVPLLVAEALTFTKDWNALRAHLMKTEWGDLEFLRKAFHARQQYETQGQRRTGEFKPRWERALVDTAGNPASLAMLARLVQGWGWQDEAAQAWWLLAARNAGQRTALKALYRIHAEAKNTRELHRVALRILEVEPDNPIAKNNAASLSLLLDLDLDRAHQLADEVLESNPNVPAFVATKAFSLLKRQRAQEAAALLGKLPESAFTNPSTAACRGLVLAAVGENEKARPFLERAMKSDALFPEERNLVEQALQNP
jgi:tetratricopeptide (TPR) repeat protein